MTIIDMQLWHKDKWSTQIRDTARTQEESLALVQEHQKRVHKCRLRASANPKSPPRTCSTREDSRTDEKGETVNNGAGGSKGSRHVASTRSNAYPRWKDRDLARSRNELADALRDFHRAREELELERQQHRNEEFEQSKISGWRTWKSNAPSERAEQEIEHGANSDWSSRSTLTIANNKVLTMVSRYRTCCSDEQGGHTQISTAVMFRVVLEDIKTIEFRVLN